MATEDPRETKKPRRKRRARARLRPQNIYYIVEIKNWDWDFMFGLNQTKHRDGP
jgi:hypothetical protein